MGPLFFVTMDSNYSNNGETMKDAAEPPETSDVRHGSPTEIRVFSFFAEKPRPEANPLVLSPRC